MGPCTACSRGTTRRTAFRLTGLRLKGSADDARPSRAGTGFAIDDITVMAAMAIECVSECG